MKHGLKSCGQQEAQKNAICLKNKGRHLSEQQLFEMAAFYVDFTLTRLHFKRLERVVLWMGKRRKS